MEFCEAVKRDSAVVDLKVSDTNNRSLFGDDSEKSEGKSKSLVAGWRLASHPSRWDCEGWGTRSVAAGRDGITTTADPPFDFPQGRLFGDDNQRQEQRQQQPQQPFRIEARRR